MSPSNLIKKNDFGVKNMRNPFKSLYWLLECFIICYQMKNLI